MFHTVGGWQRNHQENSFNIPVKSSWPKRSSDPLNPAQCCSWPWQEMGGGVVECVGRLAMSPPGPLTLKPQSAENEFYFHSCSFAFLYSVCLCRWVSFCHTHKLDFNYFTTNYKQAFDVMAAESTIRLPSVMSNYRSSFWLSSSPSNTN